MTDNDACRGVHRVPTLTALIEYEKKGVGVDMALKTVLGIVRLCQLYTRDTMARRRYASVVDAIIDCRMLCNFGRAGVTLRQLMSKYHQRGKYTLGHTIFLLLSYFFRIWEQLSGDANYLQKVVIHSWSRKTLSFYYRFFKSLSLTCCLMVELCRRDALKRRVNEASSPLMRCAAQNELTVSNVLIARSLCDMYVYYKWIPGYCPIPTIEYTCGLLSGMMGVWLVWRDCRCDTPLKEEVKQKWDRESSVSRLQSFSGVLMAGEGADSGD